jgi:hypothetical protein
MKKIIFKNKKIITFSTIFILILLLFLKTSFFKNLINILKFTENERIERIYGYCGGESIGYLKYLKNKYKIKTNPRVLNYEHTPPTNWSIYVAGAKDYNENQLILLNYPGQEIDIKLHHYKYNFYEFKDPRHYSILFKSLKKIKINNFIEPNIEVEFYIKDGSDKLSMLESIQIVKDLETNDFIMNQKLDVFKLKEKRFFLKFNKLKKEKKIIATLENKYNLNNYKVLDKYKNCYFIE